MVSGRHGKAGEEEVITGLQLAPWVWQKEDSLGDSLYGSSWLLKSHRDRQPAVAGREWMKGDQHAVRETSRFSQSARDQVREVTRTHPRRLASYVCHCGQGTDENTCGQVKRLWVQHVRWAMRVATTDNERRWMWKGKFDVLKSLGYQAVCQGTVISRQWQSHFPVLSQSSFPRRGCVFAVSWMNAHKIEMW